MEVRTYLQHFRLSLILAIYFGSQHGLNTLKIPGYELLLPKSWEVQGTARIVVFIKKYSCHNYYLEHRNSLNICLNVLYNARSTYSFDCGVTLQVNSLYMGLLHTQECYSLHEAVGRVQ